MVIFIILVVSGVLATAWASGITKMNEKHPDYKGEDFLDLDFDENDKNSIT